MKIFLDYKKGWFARFVKLKIFISEEISSEGIFLTKIKQGERMEVEIPENIKFIYGSIDWGKTEKINIQSMSEGECLEIVPLFVGSPNLFKLYDLSFNLPIRIYIKNNEKVSG